MHFDWLNQATALIGVTPICVLLLVSNLKQCTLDLRLGEEFDWDSGLTT